MQLWNYQEARAWLLPLATIIFISLLLPVVGNIGATGHGALAWAIIAAAIALYWQSARIEALFAARLSAAQQLNQLEDELRKAETGEGPNYDWVHSFPGNGPFIQFRLSSARDLEALRHKGRYLDSGTHGSFWLGTKAARWEWAGIAFEATRSRRGLADSTYWSSGAQAVLLMSLNKPAEGKPERVH